MHNARLQDAVADAPRVSRDRIRWRPPCVGMLKLNVDGASFAGSGEVGLGGVLRDHTGSVLFSFSEVVCGTFDALIVECLALWKGISLAFEVGFRNFVVESDSSTLINYLHNDNFDLAPCGHILAAARRLMLVLDCQWIHGFREGNCVAHALARDARKFSVLSSVTLNVWMEEVPPHIQELVAFDSSV